MSKKKSRTDKKSWKWWFGGLGTLVIGIGLTYFLNRPISQSGISIDEVTHTGQGDINIWQGIPLDSVIEILNQSRPQDDRVQEKKTNSLESKLDSSQFAKSPEFSSLVARIEQAFSPIGARVMSPDFILDRTTGEKRRVDASIRYRIGTIDLLTIIESHQAHELADVDWIESLANKSRDVGANVTFAVSTLGFTEAARIKGSFYGLSLRKLSELTNVDVSDWLKVTHLTVQEKLWWLIDLKLHLYDAPEGATVVKELKDEFQEKVEDANIFIQNIDNKRFSVRNFLVEWRKSAGSFFVGVPSDGTEVEQELNQPLDRGLFHILTNLGSFDIKLVTMKLLLTSTTKSIPISRLLRYSENGSDLVHSLEWNFNDTLSLSLYRELNSGKTTMRIDPILKVVDPDKDSSKSATE